MNLKARLRTLTKKCSNLLDEREDVVLYRNESGALFHLPEYDKAGNRLPLVPVTEEEWAAWKEAGEDVYFSHILEDMQYRECNL